MNLNVVRTLTIRSTTEGVPESTAQLKSLQDAHENVARVTETSARSQLSMGKALELNERRFSSALRAQQQFAEATRLMVTQQVSANDNLAKSWQSIGGLSDKGRANSLSRNFEDPAITRLGSELEKVGLQGAVVSGALVRTRFGMVQLQQPSQQASASVSGVNVVLQQLERQAEPAAQAVSAVSRNMLLLGAGAGLAGIVGISAAIRGFVGDLAAMEKQARDAKLSLDDFQAGRFAADVVGVSAKAFADSAKGVADKLNEMATSETELSKFLAANNVAFKERGKLVLDTNRALTVAADLMTRARSEAEKGKVADLFGISKDMIPALERGGEAWMRNQQVARDLGVVIDEQIVRKAGEFDRQWQAASAKSSAYIRAWAAIAISAISDVVEAQRNKSPTESLQDVDRLITDTLTKGIEALPYIVHDIGSSIFSALDKAVPAATRIGFAFDHFGDPVIQVGIKNTADAVDKLNTSVQSLADNTPSWMKTVQAHVSFWTKKPDTSPPPTAQGAPLNFPDKGDEERARAWENEIKRVNRHTATVLADAAAVGQSEAQHAQFRAELRLLESAQRAGLGVTDEQIDQYAQLRNSMSQQEAMVKAGIKLNEEHAESFKLVSERSGQAAQAMALARVRSDTSFDRDTMFLSQTDQGIAQKLRPIYGNDTGAALKSQEAAAIRFNEQLKLSIDLSTEAATGFARDWRQTGSAITAATNALNRLADKLIDMALSGLVKQALGGLAGSFGGAGGGSGLTNLVNFGSVAGSGFNGSGAPLASANGNVFDRGNVIPFARGGVISQPMVFPFANGIGLAGEAGPEAIMPLSRGADGKLGVKGGGGDGGVVFKLNITNNAGADVEASKPRENEDGSFDIDVLIERKVNKTIGSGAADRSLRRVGGAPRVTRR